MRVEVKVDVTVVTEVNVLKPVPDPLLIKLFVEVEVAMLVNVEV